MLILCLNAAGVRGATVRVSTIVTVCVLVKKIVLRVLGKRKKRMCPPKAGLTIFHRLGECPTPN